MTELHTPTDISYARVELLLDSILATGQNPFMPLRNTDKVSPEVLANMSKEESSQYKLPAKGFGKDTRPNTNVWLYDALKDNLRVGFVGSDIRIDNIGFAVEDIDEGDVQAALNQLQPFRHLTMRSRRNGAWHVIMPMKESAKTIQDTLGGRKHNYGVHRNKNYIVLWGGLRTFLEKLLICMQGDLPYIGMDKLQAILGGDKKRDMPTGATDTRGVLNASGGSAEYPVDWRDPVKWAADYNLQDGMKHRWIISAAAQAGFRYGSASHAGAESFREAILDAVRQAGARNMHAAENAYDNCFAFGANNRTERSLPPPQDHPELIEIRERYQKAFADVERNQGFTRIEWDGRVYRIRHLDMNCLRAVAAAGTQREMMLRYMTHTAVQNGDLPPIMSRKQILRLRDDKQAEISDAAIDKIIANPLNFCVEKIGYNQYRLLDAELEERYELRLLPALARTAATQFNIPDLWEFLQRDLQVDDNIREYYKRLEKDGHYQQAQRWTDQHLSDYTQFGEHVPDDWDLTDPTAFKACYIHALVKEGDESFNIERASKTGYNNFSYHLRSIGGHTEGRSTVFHNYSHEFYTPQEMRQRAAKELNLPLDKIGMPFHFGEWTHPKLGPVDTWKINASSLAHFYAKPPATCDECEDECTCEPCPQDCECEACLERQRKQELREQLKAVSEPYQLPKVKYDDFSYCETPGAEAIMQATKILIHASDDFELLRGVLYREEQPVQPHLVIGLCKNFQYKEQLIKKNSYKVSRKKAPTTEELLSRYGVKPNKTPAERKKERIDYANWQSQSENIPF